MPAFVFPALCRGVSQASPEPATPQQPQPAQNMPCFLLTSPCPCPEGLLLPVLRGVCHPQLVTQIATELVPPSNKVSDGGPAGMPNVRMCCHL